MYKQPTHMLPLFINIMFFSQEEKIKWQSTSNGVSSWTILNFQRFLNVQLVSAIQFYAIFRFVYLTCKWAANITVTPPEVKMRLERCIFGNSKFNNCSFFVPNGHLDLNISHIFNLQPNSNQHLHSKATYPMPTVVLVKSICQNTR